jgi:hypothetical protein
MIPVMLLATLPAVMVLGIGGLVRTGAADESSRRRWTLFLLIALVVLLAVSALDLSLNSYTALSLTVLPATWGVSALLFLHFLSHRAAWWTDTKRLLPHFLLVAAFLVWIGVAGDPTMLAFLVLGGAFMALVWQTWHRTRDRILIGWALQVGLLCFSVRVAETHLALIDIPNWLGAIVKVTANWLIPEMAVVGIARLLYLSQIGARSNSWLRLIFISLLAVPILLLLGYQIVLGSIWDVATDGLWGALGWHLVSTSGVAAAMVLAWSLPGKRKLVALALALIVPLSMAGAQWIGLDGPSRGWCTSPTCVTEQRVERIDRAIQRYHQRTGDYPPTLADLVPRNLLYVPNPLIIPGQTWCYEAGEDYYRLGYVYRQHFSTPASVRVHAAVGQPLDLEWPCDDEAAKYPGYGSYYEP